MSQYKAQSRARIQSDASIQGSGSGTGTRRGGDRPGRYDSIRRDPAEHALCCFDVLPEPCIQHLSLSRSCPLGQLGAGVEHYREGSRGGGVHLERKRQPLTRLQDASLQSHPRWIPRRCHFRGKRGVSAEEDKEKGPREIRPTCRQQSTVQHHIARPRCQPLLEPKSLGWQTFSKAGFPRPSQAELVSSSLEASGKQYCNVERRRRRKNRTIGFAFLNFVPRPSISRPAVHIGCLHDASTKRKKMDGRVSAKGSCALRTDSGMMRWWAGRAGRVGSGGGNGNISDNISGSGSGSSDMSNIRREARRRRRLDARRRPTCSRNGAPGGSRSKQ
jgi:hypothetical protein